MAPGVRLGVYEITAQIGEGGMGAVYRALDTSLNRQVAIKVLPDAFAQDADRVARFEREARTLAALNHPNIASIYGLERSSGTLALVMELVEGDDLWQRIARAAIPLPEALPIARQIVAALEAAHEQGIIHRDLKPANIKVRDDGTVKVLDFGLAKALEGPVASGGGRPDLSASPTITSPAMTMAGIILGTAGYMAPEQARGRQVDKRADIWAFGCVMYEMLTARRAFAGDDVTDTIVAVVSKEPDFSAIPSAVPAHVTQALKVCLRKDPKERASDIRDVRLALDGAFDTSPSVTAAPGPAPSRNSNRLALAVATVAALGLGAAIASWMGAKNAVVAEPRVFQVESGEGISAPNVSPDGRSVAFIKDGQVCVRALDTGKTVVLQGSEGGSNPFWSPDSRSIAFFANSRLLAMPASGGAVRTLAPNAFAPFGGSWGRRGLVYTRSGQGLWLVPDGGEAKQYAAIDTAAGEANLAFPTWLPDGRVLALLTRDDRLVRSVVVLADGHRATLMDLKDEAPSWPVMAGPRTLLFQRQGANIGIWSIGVAADLASTTGEPVPVFPDGAIPSVSSDGLLVALAGVRLSERRLVWVDRSGHVQSTFGRPQSYFHAPTISPDGQTVAVGNVPPGGSRAITSLWFHQQATSQPLLGGMAGDAPAWSPSGEELAYSSVNADRVSALFVMSTSNGSEPRLIAQKRFDNNSPAWTPDGRSLIYYSEGDLWIVATDPGATPRRLLAKASHPAVSPDGRLLAYSSETTGRPEVYLTTFPVPGRIWPVSADAGKYPRWNPRGGELFFASGPRVEDDPNSFRDLSVVKVATVPSVSVGTPEKLFDAFAMGLRSNSQGFRGYDIAPDGRRILMQTTGREGTPTITAIQNVHAWIARQH